MNTADTLKFLMKLEIKGVPLGWYVFLFIMLVMMYHYVKNSTIRAKKAKKSTSAYERSQAKAIIEIRNKVIGYFLLFITFMFVFVIPNIKSNYYDMKRRSYVAPILPRKTVRNVGIRYNNPIANFLKNTIFSGVNVRVRRY